MQAVAEKGFYRPKEAAWYLGCSVATVGRLEASGLLDPRTRINARIVGWRKDALERCLDRLEREGWSGVHGNPPPTRHGLAMRAGGEQPAQAVTGNKENLCRGGLRM